MTLSRQCRRRPGAEEVPARLYTLYAPNGDPLLVYGVDANNHGFLWPTTHIARHRIFFARWSHERVEYYRGVTFHVEHSLCESTKRWAAWLRVPIVGDLAVP